jgi:hypothetical protein
VHRGAESPHTTSWSDLADASTEVKTREKKRILQSYILIHHPLSLCAAEVCVALLQHLLEEIVLYVISY